MTSTRSAASNARPVALTLGTLCASLRCLMLGLLLTLAVANPTPARAQCPPGWQPFDPSTASYPGVNGQVNATMMWDPDGPGPIAQRLVVAGSFSVAGNAHASNIAVYNPATSQWAALGTGTNGGVADLAVLPNGDLIAGGNFANAGGVSARNIAKWDGSSWSALGTGIGGPDYYYSSVSALAVLPNGDLVAGGEFAIAGEVAARNIARWDGSTWSALGAGMSGGFSPYVYALTVLPNGDLIAGGAFTVAGAAQASRIARWDGSAWLPLGTGFGGVDYPYVWALEVLPNGDLLAGGTFSTAGGAPVQAVARWNGMAWSSLGAEIDGSVYTFATLPNGELVAGGEFYLAGGVPASHIAKWDGSAWSALGAGASDPVISLTLFPDGNLIAGGMFIAAGEQPANGLAQWNGGTWSSFSTGVNGNVLAFTTIDNGDVIMGGEFASVGGGPASRVARWNGSQWTSLGSGLQGGFPTSVQALARLSNGDIVAGGSFARAGGVPARNIARWNGTAWSPLGDGLDFTVVAVTVLSGGDLVAGGYRPSPSGWVHGFVSRWNGSAWTPLATAWNGHVNALATLANGDLIAGGSFTFAGAVRANRIARWTGSGWAPLSSGMTFADGSYAEVNALTTTPSGALIAGGFFAAAGDVPAQCIARWNGSQWSPLGRGLCNTVFALVSLANGDVIAGGDFSCFPADSPRRIARWNGSGWLPLGTGINPGGSVLSLAAPTNGDILIGGRFAVAGSTLAPSVARYTTRKLGLADVAGPVGAVGPDGDLTGDDFILFVNWFSTRDPRADIARSGPQPAADSEFTADDLILFVNRFITGC